MARSRLAENLTHLSVVARDDLALLVSELVTNAVRHGRPEVVMHLIVTADQVRVEVYDEGDAFSAIGTHAVPIRRIGGRGLVVVDQLATRWGIKIANPAQAKNVWFELSVSSSS